MKCVQIWFQMQNIRSTDLRALAHVVCYIKWFIQTTQNGPTLRRHNTYIQPECIQISNAAKRRRCRSSLIIIGSDVCIFRNCIETVFWKIAIRVASNALHMQLQSLFNAKFIYQTNTNMMNKKVHFQFDNVGMAKRAHWIHWIKRSAKTGVCLVKWVSVVCKPYATVYFFHVFLFFVHVVVTCDMCCFLPLFFLFASALMAAAISTFLVSSCLFNLPIWKTITDMQFTWKENVTIHVKTNGKINYRMKRN